MDKYLEKISHLLFPIAQDNSAGSLELAARAVESLQQLLNGIEDKASLSLLSLHQLV